MAGVEEDRRLDEPARPRPAIADSGLRGRGGSAYSTGAKWRAAAAEPADERYVVANGFEADSGARLDRTLIENDPHAIVEGLALAAYAIGARRAYICVRERATLARQRLEAAVRMAEAQGYIGSDALGTGVDVHIEVVALPGGMIVGEETVLLRAIQNKRAQPDQRPPYPSEKGLYGRPTVVNNVETLSFVPWIVANGSAAFAEIGDDDFPGTTLVQITGAVSKPGIVEVLLGMSLKRLLESAGGVGKRRPSWSAARPAASCPHPSSTRSIRPPRSTKRGPSGAAELWSYAAPRRASLTWPPRSSECCPTNRAARPSRAGSASAACTRWASEPHRECPSQAIRRFCNSLLRTSATRPCAASNSARRIRS